MTQLITGFTEAVKILNKSNTKKGIDSLNNMIKGIGQQVSNFAAGQGAITGIVGVLGDFLTAINPFAPLFQTLADIFGVYADIIAAKLAPIMEELFKILLSPEVLNLIELLADVFLELFKALMPILQPLINLVVMCLTPFLEIIKAVVSWITKLNIPFEIFKFIIVSVS